MAIRFPGVLNAKQFLRRSVLLSKGADSASLNVPKGHGAVYVGEDKKKRFIVPISFLNQPLFQDLLRKAEDEYGFDHPTGGLQFPAVKISSSISHLDWMDVKV